MAYKKKSSKTSTRPKKSWQRATGKALTAISAAGVKTLRKKLGLNPENKNWDVVNGNTLAASAAFMMSPTSLLAQGSTDNTRNGNGMRITHWKLRGEFVRNVSATSSQQVRMIIFRQATVNNGALINASQLLQVPGNIDSPYNSDLSDCRILMDKTILVNPAFAAAGTTIPFKYKWSPSYDAGHVRWSDADTTGVASNLVEGYIAVYIYTDAAANFGAVAWYSRVHFVDN